MIPRDDEKVKRIVASNIAHYRKECNLTQDELADMIFYSGKSVSKWERGDGMPDVCVLVALADIFGVTVNDMLAEKHKKAHHAQPQLKRNIITLMSLALVWLIATLVYFFIRIAAPQMERAWLAFIIAIPVMFIVAIVLTSLWHPRILRFLSISGLVWGIALALHLSFRIENMFLIEHMYDAPESALKVYLYARMLALHPELGGDMAETARFLRLDEDAVYKALEYWERQGMARRLTDYPPTYELLPVRGRGQRADVVQIRAVTVAGGRDALLDDQRAQAVRLIAAHLDGVVADELYVRIARGLQRVDHRGHVLRRKPAEQDRIGARVVVDHKGNDQNKDRGGGDGEADLHALFHVLEEIADPSPELLDSLRQARRPPFFPSLTRTWLTG